MVHVLKVKNIPLDINEEQITRILKFVKIDDITKIKFKTNTHKKSSEIKKTAYVYCNIINQMLLCGEYLYKYKLNEYEISYYKKKEKSK